jgi:uncharacterized protein (DUF433 family)
LTNAAGYDPASGALVTSTSFSYRVAIGKSLEGGYDGFQGKTMKERIAVDPRTHFGKPCVAGTRIAVQNVLELVREEIPFADIIRDYYPELKSEDIRACIQTNPEIS